MALAGVTASILFPSIFSCASEQSSSHSFPLVLYKFSHRAILKHAILAGNVSRPDETCLFSPMPYSYWCRSKFRCGAVALKALRRSPVRFPGSPKRLLNIYISISGSGKLCLATQLCLACQSENISPAGSFFLSVDAWPAE